MTAGIYDLKIEKGGTFRKNIILTDSAGVPVDLTGYTARISIRRSTNSSDYFLDLTTENGGITITGVEGKLALFISAVNTAAITEDKGTYDLELYNGAEVTKLLRGSVTILEEITK